MTVAFTHKLTMAFTHKLTTDPWNPSRFGRATQDWNPIHFDKDAAARARSGRPIAHDMLVTGAISALLARLAGPDEHVMYQKQEFGFVGPVYVGETIKVVAESAAVDPDVGVISRARANLATEVFVERDGVEWPVVRGWAVIRIFKMKDAKEVKAV
jgi:acyl dehydratase